MAPYAEDNPDLSLTPQQRYYRRNLEKMRLVNNEYYKKNRDKCIKLSTEYHKKRKEADPNYRKLTPAEARLRRLKRYGLTPQSYADMMNSQAHSCLICLVPFGNGKTGPVIDHCHASGRTRGILCIACNAGLGNFTDNPDLLKRAIEYLGKP